MRKIETEGLIGKKFGLWTVLRVLEPTPDGRRLCRCRCDCGEPRWVRLDGLVLGKSRSCGCALPKPRKQNKYGDRRAHNIPEYYTWRAMRRRCLSPKHQHYDLYGGRGIKVCARWSNDFLAFLTDMGPRPSPQHSIDRIDVNGNYEPSNCRWATHKEQSRNKRDNVLLRCGDIIGTLAEWSEVCGVPDELIQQRVQSGWSSIDAVLRPVDHRRGHHVFKSMEYKSCRL